MVTVRKFFWNERIIFKLKNEAATKRAFEKFYAAGVWSYKIKIISKSFISRNEIDRYTMKHPRCQLLSIHYM